MSLAEGSRTLYDKIWDNHVVHAQEDGHTLLYIDRHIISELSSFLAFDSLRETGRPLRRPDLTLATVDHNIPTNSRKGMSSVKTFIEDPNAREQYLTLEQNSKEFGLQFFGLNDKRQGISHIIAPEQGFSLPGITCVCGDSHTSTHGAFGAIAFGIGSTEVEHVFATQTILQKKSKNMRISVDGSLHEGVTSKDVILHIIGKIGMAGATGCVIEYTGSVFRGFSMEARMSVCNMSIEAGARAGMIAPDEITFEYLKGRPLAPRPGPEWDRAEQYWRTLCTDPGARFDIDVHIDASDIVPSVTWGTSPQDVVPITGSVPDPVSFPDTGRRSGAQRSLEYMGLEPGTRMQDISVDKVFLGSCTNGRIEDIRSAAAVLIAAGPEARVPSSVHAIVVPGSGIIKEQAEAEGLDAVFKRAGFDWREAGCSMCCGMNSDRLTPGQRCASTSNRNFEGRQGRGGRTHLMSPAMAAATALNGKLTDVRKYSVHGSETTIGIKQLSAVELKVASHELAPSFSPPSDSDNGATSERQTPDIKSGPVKVSQFTLLKGIAAPLELENVDTDTIIPTPFLQSMKRTGLGVHVFNALRVNPYTGEKTDFILNRAPYNKSSILVCTGANFGCGSSREAAPWSLKDFGIKCIVAPSFAEIFENNCMKNGLLPITLPLADCEVLHTDAASKLPLEVDLEKLEIRRENGQPSVPFKVDPFRRHCLLEGLDDIALTLSKMEYIDKFERRRSEAWPWLDGLGYQRGKAVNTVPSKDIMEW